MTADDKKATKDMKSGDENREGQSSQAKKGENQQQRRSPYDRRGYATK